MIALQKVRLLPHNANLNVGSTLTRSLRIQHLPRIQYHHLSIIDIDKSVQRVHDKLGHIINVGTIADAQDVGRGGGFQSTVSGQVGREVTLGSFHAECDGQFETFLPRE